MRSGVHGGEGEGGEEDERGALAVTVDDAAEHRREEGGDEVGLRPARLPNMVTTFS